MGGGGENIFAAPHSTFAAVAAVVQLRRKRDDAGVTDEWEEGGGAEVDAAAIQSGWRNTRAHPHVCTQTHADACWVFGGRFNHGDTRGAPAARRRPSPGARRDEHSQP